MDRIKVSDPLKLAVAFRLARRELRGGTRGFRVLIACLALGVGAIAIVQSVASAIYAGLQQDARAILGGDLAIDTHHEPLSAGERGILDRQVAAVSEFMEMRAMAVIPGTGENTLIEFKAVDESYPLYGSVVLEHQMPLREALASTRGRPGLVAEPVLLERLGVDIGDELRIGDALYQIRGIVRHEPDRAGTEGGFGFAPRVLVDMSTLPVTGLIQDGSHLHYRYRLALPPHADVRAVRATLETEFADRPWRWRDRTNPSQRVGQIVARITLFLTLAGLAALLVGGVGVSNAVKSYLASKVDVIATLKCVGATRRIIFASYALQILALAGIGILIGIGAGAIAPWSVSRLFAASLPLPLVAGVYPAALLQATALGVLTAATFAVWPLARTSRIPPAALFRDTGSNRHRGPDLLPIVVTAAGILLLVAVTLFSVRDRGFAAWFLAGSAAAVIAFRLVARMIPALVPELHRAGRPALRLAIANLHRPGSPAPDVILSIGLGLTLLTTIMVVESNLDRQVNDSIPEVAPAFFFMDVQSTQIDSFSELIRSDPGAGELQKVPYLRGRIMSINGDDPQGLLTDPRHSWLIEGDRGLTYSTEKPADADLIAGEWWPADYTGPPLLSIHQDVADAFAIDVGDRITLNILGRNITGTVKNIRAMPWQTLQLNFAIMLSPEPLRQAPHSWVATLPAEPEAESRIQNRVVAKFPNVSVIRVREALDTVDRLLSRIGIAVRSVAAITVIAGVLVLGAAIAAGHRRRIYESVLLKVFGATRRDVLAAYLIEFGLLGVFSAAMAALIGSLAGWAILRWFMEGDWVWVPSVVAMTVLGCTALTIAFGFSGTWRALAQKSAPLLRNE